MEIRDNIIKKWYNINKILIRIFIVWILIIPLGHIIVPYNYYYLLQVCISIMKI